MEPKRKYEEYIFRLVPMMPEEQLAKVVSLMEKLQEEDEEKRIEAGRKAIEKAYGIFKDVPGTVDDFMRRKEEEKQLDL